MRIEGPDRAIRGEAVVDAGVDAIWEAWTTAEGITSFFAPACNIELRVGGLYEILFDPAGRHGERGAEGMRTMALQPRKMLAFTWNAPPHLVTVRSQMTHVVVRFEPLGPGWTRVTLWHDGWGEGGEWDEAYEYFVKAWNDVVLYRFEQRFKVGPVDWSKPPRRRPQRSACFLQQAGRV